MAWDLEHQDQIGVEDGERRPALRKQGVPGGRKLLLYLLLALVPIALFGLMLLLARR